MDAHYPRYQSVFVRLDASTRTGYFYHGGQARRFTVVCSKELLTEYETTLTYPKITKLIFPELRRVFLTQLKDEMEIVALPHIDPVCRDPDDDKVIATAIYGNVDYLATADDDLQVEPVTNIIRTQGIRLTTIDEILTMLP